MTRAWECRDRVSRWAETEKRLAAAVVFGSVASGGDGEFSDLDLVLIAKQGQRQSLWQERGRIASLILGDDVGWAHEPTWHREFKYQAWRRGFDVMVDLTFDEEVPELWRGLVDGYDLLVDHADVARSLSGEVSEWEAPEVDALLINDSAWPWLGYLDSNLRHGRHWTVRSSLHDFLNARVLPLLAERADATDGDLSAEDRQTVHDASPTGGDATELRRSLRAVASLYQSALERWAASCGREAPEHPMASSVRDRL